MQLCGFVWHPCGQKDVSPDVVSLPVAGGHLNPMHGQASFYFAPAVEMISRHSPAYKTTSSSLDVVITSAEPHNPPSRWFLVEESSQKLTGAPKPGSGRNPSQLG